MTDNEKKPSTGNSTEPNPAVPEKQVHRWKDDGGALPPEPDPERDSDKD